MHSRICISYQRPLTRRSLKGKDREYQQSDQCYPAAYHFDHLVRRKTELRATYHVTTRSNRFFPLSTRENEARTGRQENGWPADGAVWFTVATLSGLTPTAR